jgi:hypothetical protein
MPSTATRWGVSIVALISATLAATPSQSVGQTAYATQDENIADAAYCPPTVLVQLTSDRTGVRRVYTGGASRGADAPLGKVYYTFTRLLEDNGTYIASGNFWVLGLECRLFNSQLLSTWIEIGTSVRTSWIEVDGSSSSYASGCPSRDDTSSGAYDPYSDSGEAPVNGGPQCDGGTSGGGSDPGQPPPAPTDGSSCAKQWLVIEYSNDGGATWEVWWQGEAYLCQ